MLTQIEEPKVVKNVVIKKKVFGVDPSNLEVIEDNGEIYVEISLNFTRHHCSQSSCSPETNTCR